MNRNMLPVRASDHEVQILAGNVAIGTSGAVGTQTGLTGVDVTHVTTGKYQLQLRGSRGEAASVPAILCVGASIVPGDSKVTVVHAFDADAGTADIYCYDDSAVLADPTSGDVLEFVLFVKNSGLKH